MFEQIISQLNWTEVVIFVLATAGGGALLWYKQQIKDWRVFWAGVLDGLRSIPEIKSDVKGIRMFVAPDGGGSLADSVRRTEIAVSALTEQVDLVMHTVRAENDSDDSIGRFHCSATGENTYVNQTYARWLGVGKAELMGWNYLNFVAAADVDRVRKHWEVCRAEHRQYRIRHHMTPVDGAVVEVEMVATPIPEVSPSKRWIGTVRRITNERRKQTTDTG